MTSGRPPVAFLLFFAVLLLGLLAFLGTTAFQALSGDGREAPRSFVEQLEALPVVQEVETETGRVAGSGGARSLKSWVTLSPALTDDPDGAAAQLTGVTWGYDRSHWSVAGLGSTAEVSYRAPMDQAPVLWWARSVAELAQGDPQAALHCRITDAALHCEVEAGDPQRAREALAGVDASGLQPWLDDASPDEGERTGFSLTVGGHTLSDPASVR
ncbi:hypothetical protein [Ornithinimicrobium pekingense]|uniref:Uncharacterized protein n=1 Tax=Ornithinimicrobium pekingense TaxID=384677 RepID=A0ABQ2FBP8_9MICO|nr:hypothetical protein [Ornithinimicrobium pekingense]GGK80353.1 hypothetical protein GCM10011509_31070 [Ornithinimicrobium pekingense]